MYCADVDFRPAVLVIAASLVSFGVWSLLPSLVAIVLAIVTRRVIASLGVSVVVGAGMLAMTPVASLPYENVAAEKAVAVTAAAVGAAQLSTLPASSLPVDRASAVGAADLLVPADQNPGWRWLNILWYEMWLSVFDASHVSVLKFSLLLGAMIGVLEASRAVRRLIAFLGQRVRGRRGGQTMVASLGLVIFFDDYANTLLLGGTMRRVCDTLRISRAKLAYLVDSTAAPVAGLALVSTWVATEISLIEKGLPEPAKSQAFGLFLESILYRFYPLFALALVFLIARTGRDFGAMREAEVNCLRGETPGSEVSGQDEQGASEAAGAPTAGLAVWAASLTPILICVAVIAAVLVATGRQAVLEDQGGIPSGLQGWGVVLGNADSYQALVWGGAAGLATAIACGFAMAPQLETLPSLLWGAVRGAWQILPAMVVLWFAWALSAMTDDGYLNTGNYLGGVLESSLPAWTLPTVVFVVSGLVAFSTGTSWGTMALLTPLAVKLSVQMAGGEIDSSLVLATTGSVLAGAIWGDHCSPISDTTVLSSRACGCDHVLHVRTQLPYAMLAGGVAIGLGTLPVALGLPWWLLLVAGVGVLSVAVRFFGQPAEESRLSG